MSIPALDTCLGVCWAVLGSSPRQPLFQAQPFLPFDGEAAAGRGRPAPSHVATGKGFQRVGIWVLWVGSFESQPGPVFPATGVGLLAQLASLCQACVCPEVLCELMLHLGRAGTPGAQSAELQETWEEKAMSGYLGFGSGPATPPAIRPCPPKWLCGHAFYRSDGSAATLKPLLASNLPSEESQNMHAKKGNAENRKFFIAAGFLSTRECVLSGFSFPLCANSGLFHPCCCLGLDSEQESSLLKSD